MGTKHHKYCMCAVCIGPVPPPINTTYLKAVGTKPEVHELTPETLLHLYDARDDALRHLHVAVTLLRQVVDTDTDTPEAQIHTFLKSFTGGK